MESVQVIVIANDAASGVLRGITAQFGQLGQMVDQLSATNINWGNIASIATTMVIDGVRDAIKVTVDYDDKIRQLMRTSGQGAEATSRFVAVLDDFEISADDALTATRALTKQGLTPSIETLAKLSDQYVKLTSAQERNEFSYKNLGKANLKWSLALSKGSTAINEMGESVEKNLIRTDEALQQTEDYKISVDALADSWKGFQIEIGGPVINALTDLMNQVRDNTRANEILLAQQREMVAQGKAVRGSTEAEKAAALQAAAAEREHADALRRAAGEAGDLGEALQAIDYKSGLDLIMDTERENDKYIKGQQDLRAEIVKVNGEFNTHKISVSEYNQKIGELTGNLNENAAEHLDWQKKTVFALLTTKLAADGMSDAELGFLLDTGAKMGIISDQTVTEAEKMVSEANTALGGFDTSVPTGEAATFADQWDRLVSAPKNLNFTVNLTQTGPSPADIVELTGYR